MLARALEETGLPTVTLALVKEHAQRVQPPRALFVPFPYGYALGRPEDPDFQHRVIAAALDLFTIDAAPVLAEFLEEGDAPARLVQASSIQSHSSNQDGDPAAELTAMRGYYERWVDAHGGQTQVGVTGIPPRRFRGLVRFLETFVAGETAPYPDQPEDIPTPVFIRRAADDLKAFMLEARMSQRPNDRDNALQEWFWGDTAIGALLNRVAKRFADEGDQRSGSGIAR